MTQPWNAARSASRRPLRDRFWKYVDKRGDDECWVWTRYRSPQGYGRITIAFGEVRLAHRMAFEFEKGPIPDGHLVRHTCDNPPCCNPAHLITGLKRDNSADMVARGRQQAGERHHAAKLTEGDVREIRGLALAKTSQSEIARRFGISQQAVSDIVAFRTWRRTA